MNQKKSIAQDNASLTFVGVGPGDPSLITFAGIQAIKNASVIAYPIANENEESIAAQIASPWIDSRQRRLPLVFPMVEDPNLRKAAWRIAREKVISYIENDKKVVFISQGDVSIFSTSAYLLLGIKSDCPHCKITQIPGITSFCAAAAIGDFPLCLQNDQLLISPTPDTPEEIYSLLDEAAKSRCVVVFVKLGHRWEWVKDILQRKNLLENSLFAQRVGFADQEVINASCVSKEIKSYFSLVIIRQNWPSLLP